MSGTATDPTLTSYIGVLTAWDWGLGIATIVSALMGLVRGFVRTLAYLAAWLLALFAAPLLLQQLDLWLIRWNHLSALPRWVEMVIVFLVVFVVVRFAGTLLMRGVRRMGLGSIDRLFGMVFGVARALLIVGTAAVVAHRLGFSSAPSWRQAQCRPLLDTMVQLAQPMLRQPLPPARSGA